MLTPATNINKTGSYVLYGVECIDIVSLAPYVLYGVECIDIVSLAPYVLYGVECIDIVSRACLSGACQVQLANLRRDHNHRGN